jgi:hypothetical protein
MHFFRALWENSLDTAGFMVRNDNRQKLTLDSLVIQENNNSRYLFYQGRINIYYYSTSALTMLNLSNNTVYFDKLGYFDPLGIRWNGEMIKQRMGDQLPFDYKLK